MGEGESLPLSRWLLAHKSSFCAGDQPVSFAHARVRLHDGQSTPGFRLPRLQGHPAPDGKARRIAHVHPRRHHHLPLQIVVIRHYIVEQAVDDSAMRHTVVAGVLVSGREFGAAYQSVFISLNAKADLQTYGVLWAADETMIGQRIKSHQINRS